MLLKYKEGLGKKKIYPRNFSLIQSIASNHHETEARKLIMQYNKIYTY